MPKKHSLDESSKKSPAYIPLLVSAFFLSGATSLSLEVAWSKELSYLLGVDIYAATTVIAAFMAGLGLGAWFVARYYPWSHASLQTYGWLQLGIGLCGVVSIPLFRATSPVFSLLYDLTNYQSQLFLLVRFLLVFVLMLIPVTMMGMTLPVVVGASSRRTRENYAYLSGLLYGMNTVGAVFGTLAAGFLIVPTLGILNTCLLTGLIDLVIGVLVLVGNRDKETAFWKKPKRLPDPPVKSISQPLPAAAGSRPAGSWPAIVILLSGIVALSYEIVWFRLLARVVGPSVQAFSIMLAIYLIGIGLGSVLGSRWVKRQRNDRAALFLLLALIGIAPLVSLLFINQLPVWYGKLFIAFSETRFTYRNVMIQAGIASLLILPATLGLGAMFPVIVKIYSNLRKARGLPVEPVVGQLYCFNTIGSVAGSLLAGFWLVPTLGIKSSLIAAGTASVLLAIAVLLTSEAKPLIKLIPSGAVLGAALVPVWISPGLNHAMLNSGLYSMMLDREQFSQYAAEASAAKGKLLFYEEGINSSVAVIANKFNDGNLTLHLSGGWVSSTELHGRLHLEFLGHLPMLLSKNPETVAVIGYGAGITSGNLLLYPEVKRVNVFELEQGVVHASRFFEFINQKPLEDPRLHLYLVDGRSHITYEKFTYDVITSDPIHPYMAGSANLYTEDFYRISRNRLNHGGIYCQWIPLVGISPDSFDTILNTMHRVFPHLAVFSFFGEAVVVASVDPIAVEWEALEQRFYTPRVYADFKSFDFLTPYNLLDFFIAAEDQITEHLKRTDRVNTDDNVWIEHRIPQDALDLSHGNLQLWLQKTIRADGRRSVRQVFRGISLQRLEEELAALGKNGDWHYEQAEKARQANRLQEMEEGYRKALEDVNARNNYPAGLKLARYLASDNRIESALEITAVLQHNYPAFPEPYVLAAECLLRAGKRERALETLERGLEFNPDQPDLVRMLSAQVSS